MSVFLLAAPIVAVVLAALWLAVAFNRLVRDRNLMREAWSGIDVQLKRRHSLIPNLVAVVEGYSAHERGTLEQVTRARTRSLAAQDHSERESSENALSGGLRGLLAVAEAYPDLKADRTFGELHRQLVEVEDQLQYARRYYNATARDYNTRTESFPSNIAARLFRFSRAAFFEIETATEREAPKVEA
jgi:LemA protein